MGKQIMQTAFSVGIERVATHEVTTHFRGERSETHQVINIETSTPKAKQFVDKLLAAEYFDPGQITFSTKQPRSIMSNDDVSGLTVPLVEPSTDLCQELWQFSHITYGLIGRIFIAACLLALGLIEGKVLLVVGGLLFIPILPMAMATSYGIAGRQWKLAIQGVYAIAASAVTLLIGGALVAMLTNPPVRFDDIGSPGMGIVISFGVGVAASLAALDDAGRRELIGLAAASQLALIPVWFGIAAIFSRSTDTDSGQVATRLFSFAANLAVLIVTILAVQFATGVVGKIRRIS
jgi:hypothetical protein